MVIRMAPSRPSQVRHVCRQGRGTHMCGVCTSGLNLSHSFHQREKVSGVHARGTCEVETGGLAQLHGHVHRGGMSRRFNMYTPWEMRLWRCVQLHSFAEGHRLYVACIRSRVAAHAGSVCACARGVHMCMQKVYAGQRTVGGRNCTDRYIARACLSGPKGTSNSKKTP